MVGDSLMGIEYVHTDGAPCWACGTMARGGLHVYGHNLQALDAWFSEYYPACDDHVEVVITRAFGALSAIYGEDLVIKEFFEPPGYLPST